MRLKLSVDAKALRNKLDGYAKRASASEWKAASPAFFKAMREGDRGVSQMFRRGFTYWPNGSEKKWKETEQFGWYRPPTRTLIRTGLYRDAWMGRGPGTVEGYANGRFTFGVDPVVFPRVKVFQKNGVTRIRITQKMRNFVRFWFGVNFSKKKTHIKVEGRPISVSPEMKARGAQAIKRFILRAKAEETSAASAREVA